MSSSVAGSSQADRAARRTDIRAGSVTGPWRGGSKEAPSAVFVPSWGVPAEDDLRAPMLRKGGVAVRELPESAPRTEVPAEPSPISEPAEATFLSEAPPLAAPTRDAPPAEEVAHVRPVLVAPAKPRDEVDALSDWVGVRPPSRERSRRSVLVACVLGAGIAAGIVALAFAFRPALHAETAPATATSPASEPAPATAPAAE